MSIAISVRVNDGFAIATDSATRLVDEQGQTVNIFNTANKMIHLATGLPIGMLFWGAGNIGDVSMVSVTKDFRRILLHGDENGNGKLDRANFSVLGLAEQAREYIYDRIYRSTFDIEAGGPFPAIGLYTYGFGTGDKVGREFLFHINSDGSCTQPVEFNANGRTGILTLDADESAQRLITGISGQAKSVFRDLGFDDGDAAKTVATIQSKLNANLVHPSMSIKDATDLATFLVKTAIEFERFQAGPTTIGEPLEVAAITRREGFKWIARQMFFSMDLNPVASASL